MKTLKKEYYGTRVVRGKITFDDEIHIEADYEWLAAAGFEDLFEDVEDETNETTSTEEISTPVSSIKYKGIRKDGDQ